MVFQQKSLHEQTYQVCRADWIRTSDPYVPNVVRYRAALLPEKRVINFVEWLPLIQKSRVDWIRTSDLLHPMQMRYRAAPPPETGLQM